MKKKVVNALWVGLAFALVLGMAYCVAAKEGQPIKIDPGKIRAQDRKSVV